MKFAEDPALAKPHTSRTLHQVLEGMPFKHSTWVEEVLTDEPANTVPPIELPRLEDPPVE